MKRKNQTSLAPVEVPNFSAAYADDESIHPLRADAYLRGTAEESAEIIDSILQNAQDAS